MIMLWATVPGHTGAGHHGNHTRGTAAPDDRAAVARLPAHSSHVTRMAS